MKTALLVGAGRRVSFAERLRKRGYHILAYELKDTVPIAAVAEIVIGRPWSESHEHLQAVIDDRQPHLTFLLQDEAVSVGSQIVRSGMVAPPYDVAEKCFDKLEFSKFMMWSFEELYPQATPGMCATIFKPRFGYGSRGVQVVRMEDIGSWYRAHDGSAYVAQAYIEGEEYTVDAYFDRSGRFVDAAPRLRERVAAGEVISSRMVRDVQLRDLTCHVGERMGLRGPACFQFIREKYSERPYLFEVNARFGGGCILSMEAGFDQLALIERDWLGKPCAYVPNKWSDTLAMHRFNQEFFYHAV